MTCEDIIGLNIATRCDAITPECLDYLTELNKKYNSNSKSIKTLVRTLRSNGRYSFVKIGKKEDIFEGDLVTIDGESYTGYHLD